MIFPNLKKLVVYATEATYCCKPLLRSCHHIEYFTLNDCDDITDDELFDIVSNANPMSRCEEINLLGAARLTIRRPGVS